ncbi:hypothetical protein EDD17DRAFT_1043823 [Pisolithus thermaeus]|nr:hypothetical protein EV401DRAFT_975826 [Pisolithus croceorrhizus]KAI6167525.1 hypothetical protein EDD17DRAFT_1043823 [Pisolithus thermaeus]
MEPELAADGCNWHTYGSWVLKVLSEDNLMGYLDGSETRPTNPRLLQGDGDGWTPQTDEEREAVMVWRTADNAWQQRAAMAHYLIISGIPDSILMLIMHLETPHETFAYLENHYGRIPRPETRKVVDEAIQQHDMPYEQCEAENGNNEPVNSHGREDDSLDIPSDSAETTDGHTKPEVEVVDARQAGDDLQVVVDRATDLEWPAECASTLEAPDKGSQCASDKVVESWDLPEVNSEALEPAGHTTRLASRCCNKCIPRTCLEYSQHAWTNGETILDIPDPPSTRSGHPTLGSHCANTYPWCYKHQFLLTSVGNSSNGARQGRERQ